MNFIRKPHNLRVSPKTKISISSKRLGQTPDPMSFGILVSLILLLWEVITFSKPDISISHLLPKAI